MSLKNEFIQKYAPLSVDVATWLNVSFPCAVERLESLRERGIISRMRRKSPWRVRLKDEAITPAIHDEEKDIVGRLLFTTDDKGQLLIKVKPKSSGETLTSDETVAVLVATESQA